MYPPTPHVQTRQAPRPSYTAPPPQTSYGAPNGQKQETLIVPVPIPEPFAVFHQEEKLSYHPTPIHPSPLYPYLPRPVHPVHPVHPQPYGFPSPLSTSHPPEQTLLSNILLARAYAPTTSKDLDSLLSRYVQNWKTSIAKQTPLSPKLLPPQPPLRRELGDLSQPARDPRQPSHLASPARA